MKYTLEKFEKYCTTPGIESGKARSYQNAIKYLCDFLNIRIIDKESIQIIKNISESVTDLNSHVYKNLLTFLRDRHQSSYLEKGYIRAALPQFLTFINDDIFNNWSANSFPDSDQTDSCIEGAKISVTVNKYERNPIARQKCIETNGCYCHICTMDFEKVYGKVGKDFIHVHHLKPLSEIGEEYIVDPINDLLPVCPNCHAMLHRKVNDEYLSVDDFKKMFSVTNI